MLILFGTIFKQFWVCNKKTGPIEDFQGIIKGKVYAKNWSAKSIPELKRKIGICLKEMVVNLVQSIAESVQKRLDTVHRKGYDAL